MLITYGDSGSSGKCYIVEKYLHLLIEQEPLYNCCSYVAYHQTYPEVAGRK